jgi:hypothetical protein
MSVKTLNELMRDQILAEGPQIELPDGATQADYIDARNTYIDDQLNSMTNLELLERISAAHEVLDAKLLEQVKSWL